MRHFIVQLGGVSVGCYALWEAAVAKARAVHGVIVDTWTGRQFSAF